MINLKKCLAYIATVSLMFVAVSAVGNTVYAQGTPAPDPGLIGPSDLGVSYAGSIGLGGADIRTTIASIIRVAMGLLGIVAVVIILIGGFTWMTAGGNDDKVGEAKKWIYSGVIGLAIILSAYALSNFVINSLIDATVNVPGADSGLN